MHFNSHAHVERDLRKLGTQYGLIRISTHTLTWSVTLLKIVATLQLFISTHTLTWSVTAIIQTVGENICISTHTLTWSVTGVFAIFVKFFTNFNSHAHVERDLNFLTMKCISQKFQLTRSRGA